MCVQICNHTKYNYLQGQEANPERTACVDCVAGKYQELTTGGSCKDCQAGNYSPDPKSATCTPCALVSDKSFSSLCSKFFNFKILKQ